MGNKKVIRWLMIYFKSEYKRIFLCFLLYPANQLAITFGGALGYESMINGLSYRDTGLFRQGVIVYLLCFLMSIGFISASTWLSHRLSYRLRKKIQGDLLEHVLFSNNNVYNQMDSSEFFIRLNKDNDIVTSFISKQFFVLISPLIVGTVCIVALVVRDWIIGVIVILCVFSSLIWQQYYGKKFKACLLERHSALDKLYTSIGESISAALIVRTFFAKEQVKAQTDELIECVHHLDRDHAKLKGMHHAIGKFFSSTATIVPMLLGIVFVGLGRLDLGAIMYITQLSRNSIWMVDQLSMMLSDIQNVLISASNIQNIMTQPSDEVSLLVERDSGDPSTYVTGELSIHNLNVSYSTKKVLSNLNLHVDSGKKVAIIGESGQGKSTLLKTIMSFVPYKGIIRICGQEIDMEHPRFARKNITYISQDPFILEGSILENIWVGNLNANIEQVLSAARVACVDEFIRDLPAGYDTMLSESSRLSRGQYQRICFARAVLHDTPIWLLDEFTASIDLGTVEKLLEHCPVLMREKTVLIITHTPEQLHFLDEVYCLLDGKLIKSDIIYNNEYERKKQ